MWNRIKNDILTFGFFLDYSKWFNYELGYVLKLHDFKANKSELQALNCGAVCSDINALVEQADLLMILNNHLMVTRIYILVSSIY